MTKILPPAVWLGYLLCGFFQTLAQTNPTPPPEPVIRISVNLVQVDAVVTDSSGRQVTNLTAVDFEIFEDGRPQKITACSYVRTGPPDTVSSPSASRRDPHAPPAPAMRLTPEQVRRTVVLMVDDLGLSFESAGRVRSALRKYVDTQMQAGELVAIVRTRGGHSSIRPDQRLATHGG
jgi:VWFA-related protein